MVEVLSKELGMKMNKEMNVFLPDVYRAVVQVKSLKEDFETKLEKDRKADEERKKKELDKEVNESKIKKNEFLINNIKGEMDLMKRLFTPQKL